jgi:protein-disulfide isomerase
MEIISMSKRNSQAAKSAARERLRAEREREAKRAKARRQIIVACSIVGVLAASGGIGYAIVQANKPSHWEALKDAKVVAPANTTGTNGTTVVIGKDSAKKTLKIYEDPRCPICASFEQEAGATVDKDVEAGKYKLQFIGGTFLDGDSLSDGKIGSAGEGSKNAMSALGAALNVSPEAFLAYKTALYSAEFHPAESDDKFKDDDYLIKVGDSVPALKDNAKFQNAVKKGTYDAWALAMSKAFDTNKEGPNQPWTAAEFTKAVDAALKG